VWHTTVSGARAWVTFLGSAGNCPGSSCGLIRAKNVSSVIRTATGTYVINLLPGAVSGSNYSYSIFGSDAGASGTNGAAGRYSGSLRSATQLQVFQFGGDWDTKLDASEISVVFFD
jgi:hypothetical protein